MGDDDVLRVGRIDLVDRRGVSRMTLAAEAPDPVLAGVEKERVAQFSGIVVRDHDGNERGGLGYVGGPSGRVLWALDHPSFDAMGTVVAEDGTVSFLMNQAPSASAKEGGVENAAGDVVHAIVPEHD